MFLLVFVTLVISIIGLYAQVLGVQTSKINHSQYGMMQTMLAWHGAAVSLAKTYTTDVLKDNGTSALNTPCYIPSTAMGLMGLTHIPLPSVCQYTSVGPPPAAINLVLTTVSPANLPAGYNVQNFSFYSVLYNTAAPVTYYLVTYVYYTDAAAPLAANAPSGNLWLPEPGGVSGGSTVGYSMNSLVQQFARAAPLDASYGFVVNTGGIATLTATSKSLGASIPSLTYIIPANIPTGAFAIISSAN